jgi:hypothetical protein
VPESQWKDYGQQSFYGARLGGRITNVQVSPPEKAEEPFTLTYDYTLKDFAGDDKHRFAIPISALSIPEVKDEDLQRTTPLWLGYVGESLYESRIELPRGWSAAQPMALDLKESFAEFQGSTGVHDSVLRHQRALHSRKGNIVLQFSRLLSNPRCGDEQLPNAEGERENFRSPLQNTHSLRTPAPRMVHS